MSRAIKRTFIYFGGAVLVVLVIDLSGVFRHPFERDYFTEFSYPLDLPNFPSVVRRYGKKELTAYDPINYLYANLTFVKSPIKDCNKNEDTLRLVILVKSAPVNFDKRFAIRSTWGYERRFSDVPIKTVFLLGISDSDKKKNPVSSKFLNFKHPSTLSLEEAINEESAKYGDIVQADFIDSYYNNTYKTIMGMRWLIENCSNFRYAFFSDDDMYVSVKNLLKFLRHPTAYPEYWENQKRVDKLRAERRYSERKAVEKLKIQQQRQQSAGPKKDAQIKSIPHDNAIINEKNGHIKVWKNSPLDFDIDLDEDTTLYAGYVYFLPPYRHKLGSKWYLSLQEYPFNFLPPYIPAGGVALSRSTIFDLYYASLFTKHLRFDDVFIAICAKKMGIEPYHSEYFRLSSNYPTMDRDDIQLEYLIAWHGFDNPQTLIKFWNAQKSLGNA